MKWKKDVIKKAKIFTEDKLIECEREESKNKGSRKII